MVLTEEEIKERKKRYNKKYNESKKGRESNKKYRKSVNGQKCDLKKRWKFRGLNMENFEEIYKIYLDTTKCDNCDCVLTDGQPYNKPNTKCMDHNHETGEFRNILCWKCNIPAGVWV